MTLVKETAADSVTMAPKKAAVVVGQSVQLAVRDGGRRAAHGVTWESSNAQVATVSASGLVTGVAAGIASIRATYRGQTTTATVTVLVGTSPVATTPSTPPSARSSAIPADDSPSTSAASSPSTSSVPFTGSTASVHWRYEPAGFRTLTNQSWNSITSRGWKEFDSYHHVSLVPDPTVPTGEANVLEFRYPRGFSGGGYGPGLVTYKLRKDELYLGFYWKMSPNWEGHTSNVNKMFYLFQREGQDRGALLVVAYGRPGGPYHLEISNEASDDGRWFKQNVNNVPLVPGQWYKIEMHLRRSSSDAAPDGLVEWWIDGQLAARYPNAKLRGAPFSEIHIDPVWGGTDPSIHKTHADYQRFGSIHISGR